MQFPTIVARGFLFQNKMVEQSESKPWKCLWNLMKLYTLDFARSSEYALVLRSLKGTEGSKPMWHI